MFFFRHPRPVIDGRTHAVQVVQQKKNGAVSRTLLIVDQPAQEGEGASPATDGAQGEEAGRAGPVQGNTD